MRIESIDFFYLAMPEVLDIGDGSQDALLVRVRAGAHTGWGECEAAPLVSIASLVCPKSHSACKPVQESVLGQRLDGVADIRRIGDAVRENSSDLLQASHTLSGIDIALWDLMGRRLNEPVYKLLGSKKAHPKTPYASVLFGDTPEQTLAKGRGIRAQGFRAAKFGWGPIGRSTLKADVDQIKAAREGLGTDGILLIDAGTVWIDDVAKARQRIKILRDCNVLWLEEPFVSGALEEYRKLSRFCGRLKLAGGEGCHTYYMARQMIDYAGMGFIQIDTGRIGGISVAKDVALYARSKGIAYVNHTFTSHLALSASLQPYAGIKNDVICEYPAEPKALAIEMTLNHLRPDASGQIHLSDQPGLGIDVNIESARKYLVDTEITVKGRVLYRTPAF